MFARRFIATLLSVAMTMMLAGCGGGTAATASNGSAASSQTGAKDGGASSDQASSGTTVPEFASLNDPELLRYMEDSVYADLEAELGEDYAIENVTAAYVPFVSDEYRQELAYNSKENIYFGYTLSELDQQFQGTRYVFEADGDGNTTVREFEAYDDSYDQAMTNVAVGTGVILLCVTISAVSGGVGAAPVCAVFTAAAKTGTMAAASAGVLSGAVAGAAKAYETGGDMEAVAKEAALKGSEDFKWGAIFGALSGGASALRNPAKAIEAIRDGATVARSVPTAKESELEALKRFGGREQVSFLTGEEVRYGEKGATRPDIVRFVDGKWEAIEVKNYDLVNNLHGLCSTLKKEVTARRNNLPAGSKQRVVLDIRGRGYSDMQVEAAKRLIWETLQDVYPDIPIDIME